MSLNWSIKSCKDSESLQDGFEWSITEQLIWFTMFIGMNEITEKNWMDFYKRCRMYDKVFGPFMYYDSKSRMFSKEDIEKRIGLNTNASKMTDTQFKNHVFKSFYASV